jgi:hypothetical protein
MKRLLGLVLVTALVSGLANPARGADDKDAQATLDKAIKALGGAEKLGAAKALTWKSKGKISFGGNENAFNAATTVAGLDQFRGEFEGEFGGNKVMGVTVVSGDKGWRKFGDMIMELDKDGLANEKRSVYLQVIPVTLVPLKGKGFKVEAAGTEKVGDKPAVVLKVTGPEGKDYKIFFDQDSGLPVKQVAKVIGFMGEEFTQETTFADYKDFDGIKKATRIESKRDGEKFIDQEITGFKPLDKVDSKTFTEPK